VIGIQEIGTYIPAARIDNRQRMERFEVDEAFLLEKTGMTELAVKGDNEETSDLCCRAFEDLVEKSGLSVDEIECLVVCTQNPDGKGLPHTSAVVHGKLNLPKTCAAFDISLGCSGFVYGLSIIQAFMQANGMTKGVLMTADPYSKILDQNDKNTSLLFGDAATATLISDQPKWLTGRFKFGTSGQEGEAIKVNPEAGALSMNGRAVFSFSATVVPNNIKDMLTLNGLELADIDLFALHQGSRFIVDTLKKRLGLPEDRAPFVATEYGNTVSSSIPLILCGVPKSCGRIVIAGFGVGLSWGSTVLFRADLGDHHVES